MGGTGAAAWAAISDSTVRFVRARRRSGRAWRRGGVIGAAVTVAILGVWLVVSAASKLALIYEFAALAAACTAVVVAARLSAALHSAENEAAELMDTYVQLQLETDRLDRWYRERLHDARSATASVRGAVDVLGQPTCRPAEARRLRRLLDSEFDRLQALLDSRAAEPLTVFDLAEALEPVVSAYALDGTRIRSAVDHVTVSGRPRATATVLDNLLRNARVHAPGAGVEVRTSVVNGVATVTVHDDGPGIPREELARVLLPGMRGSAATAPGSGLGLHIAATAMAEQGGTLRVLPPDGRGTSVVFTLPVAVPHNLSVAPALAG